MANQRAVKSAGRVNKFQATSCTNIKPRSHIDVQLLRPHSAPGCYTWCEFSFCTQRSCLTRTTMLGYPDTQAIIVSMCIWNCSAAFSDLIYLLVSELANFKSRVKFMSLESRFIGTSMQMQQMESGVKSSLPIGEYGKPHKSCDPCSCVSKNLKIHARLVEG